MRIVLSGSRRWAEPARVVDALSRLENRGIILAHGDNGNVDTVGRDYWRSRGETDDPFPVTEAEWALPNRAGGQVRNRRMADAGMDALLAFWDGESPGTWGMIQIAQRRRVPILVHAPRGGPSRWTDGMLPWTTPPLRYDWWAPTSRLF